MSVVPERLVCAWRTGARWLVLLTPLEFLYRAIVSVRRWCYRCGLLRVYRAPVPVVVVGNISLGGTGKTAVVVALVEQLRAAGFRVGIVSRGYGALRPVNTPLEVQTGTDPGHCGDEPLMIVRRTGAPLAVCTDRARAVDALLKSNDLDIVLSDDGLQHYGLARDLEVLMYDAATGFANGRCLPVGPLREPLSRLAEADFVLAKGEDVGNVGVQYTLGALINVHSGERRAVAPADIGANPCVVAGLAEPRLFLKMLADSGFNADTRIFPDHHLYSAADFAGLEQRTILMTEKDAVKCRALAPEDSWYARLDAALPAALTEAVLALAAAGVSDTAERRA